MFLDNLRQSSILNTLSSFSTAMQFCRCLGSFLKLLINLVMDLSLPKVLLPICKIIILFLMFSASNIM